jgi:hypothetical protein
VRRYVEKGTKTAEFADQWCFSIRKLSSPFKVSPLSRPVRQQTEGKKSRTKNNFMPCLNVSFKQQTTLLIDELIVTMGNTQKQSRGFVIGRAKVTPPPSLSRKKKKRTKHKKKVFFVNVRAAIRRSASQQRGDFFFFK